MTKQQDNEPKKTCEVLARLHAGKTGRGRLDMWQTKSVQENKLTNQTTNIKQTGPLCMLMDIFHIILNECCKYYNQEKSIKPLKVTFNIEKKRTHTHTYTPLWCSPLLSWCFLSSLSGSWWLSADDRASRLAVLAPAGRGGCSPAGCGVSGMGMAWPCERCCA